MSRDQRYPAEQGMMTDGEYALYFLRCLRRRAWGSEEFRKWVPPRDGDVGQGSAEDLLGIFTLLTALLETHITEERLTHYGTLRVGGLDFFEVIRRGLGLPGSYRVWGYDDDLLQDDDPIEVFVESLEIPHVADGLPRPIVRPIYAAGGELLRVEIDLPEGAKKA